MDNMKLMEQILDQRIKEEMHNLKRDIIISNLRVDKLEAKLNIAYDELARTKEYLNEMHVYTTEANETVAAG